MGRYSPAESIDDILDLTIDALANVSVTLEQVKTTIAEANNALETASLLTTDLSTTVANTRPLMAGQPGHPPAAVVAQVILAGIRRHRFSGIGKDRVAREQIVGHQ